MLKNKPIKFLAICNPALYKSPPLDVPTFYRQVAEDSRLDFFHLPTSHVVEKSLHPNQIQVASVKGKLSYPQLLELNSKANQWHNLESFDLVFCRTLKPFPQGYLQQLSRWEKYTRFVNSPTNKIEQIKADFLLKVARDYIPETIITDDWQEALAFWEKHQTIVAKQVNSCGGRGIFKICHQDGSFLVDNLVSGPKIFDNFAQLIQYTQGTTNQPLQLVRYLHRVNEGDKRVVVVDGEIYGAYLRRSKSGYWVNNVSADGECFLTDISELEKEAIAKTVVHYQKRGLHTLGYDFLVDDQGNWRISEINAGNIGGFARLEQLTGKPMMKKFIDWLIEFAQRHKIDFLQALANNNETAVQPTY